MLAPAITPWPTVCYSFHTVIILNEQLVASYFHVYVMSPSEEERQHAQYHQLISAVLYIWSVVFGSHSSIETLLQSLQGVLLPVRVFTTCIYCSGFSAVTRRTESSTFPLCDTQESSPQDSQHNKSELWNNNSPGLFVLILCLPKEKGFSENNGTSQAKTGTSSWKSDSDFHPRFPEHLFQGPSECWHWRKLQFSGSVSVFLVQLSRMVLFFTQRQQMMMAVDFRLLQKMAFYLRKFI